jgi:hypothetical protein
MTQLARPDLARNHEVTYALARLRPPHNHCRLTARGLCGLAGEFLAGR